MNLVLQETDLNVIAEMARQAIKDYSTGNSSEQVSKRAKQEAVIAYGRALLAGRDKHRSDPTFGKWVRDNRLDVELYATHSVRNDAMKIAKASVESEFYTKLETCSVGNPTGMRVWAYKTGLIKPKPKPEARMLSYAQTQAKTLQQLKREAAIVAGQIVSPRPLDEETKTKIDEEVREQASKLELANEDKRKFEKIVRDALRKVVQEGRSYKEKCDVEQRKLINLEVERLVAVTKIDMQKEKDEAERFRKHYEELIGNRKPIFTMEEFQIIRKALHPDNRDDRAHAFSTFNSQKFRLTGVK